jgi:hypothetical protein
MDGADGPARRCEPHRLGRPWGIAHHLGLGGFRYPACNLGGRCLTPLTGVTERVLLPRGATKSSGPEWASIRRRVPRQPAASGQLVDLSLDRFLDDRLGSFVRTAGAAFRTHGQRHGNPAEDVSLCGPLVERDFLHLLDDYTAIADVADAGIVRARHFPKTRPLASTSSC